VNLFGGGKQSRKMRLVPRAPGDTTPLDPALAEAVRKAGMDPTKFTAAPYEQGEGEPPVEGLFKSGSRVEHTFLFATVDSALTAIERLVDGDTAARITKEPDGWLVVFDEAAQPGVQGAAQHERFAGIATPLGAQDRGFAHLTMNINRVEKKL
jgi:hypothetical protein